MKKIIKNPFTVILKVAVVKLCIVSMFFLFSNIVNAQQSVSWNYPVKPGMDEWNNLETEQQRIAVLQVPEEVLEKSSPEEVVGLCITLPSFFIFYAFDTPQDGYDILFSRYNIFSHMLSRKDVGSSLIAAYKDADLSGFRTLPYSNEFWTVKLYYLELLLSQKQILQSLTPNEKFELIKEARKKFVEKLTNESFSYLIDLLFSVRIMASILYVEQYPEFMVSLKNEAIIPFIETGSVFEDVPPIDEIFRITDNYINDNNSQQ